MHGPRRGSHEPRVRAGTGDGVDGGGECRGCPPGCPLRSRGARGETRRRLVAWVADRPYPRGAEVTWTYGHLSNESLGCGTASSRTRSVHAGTSVTFHLPAERSRRTRVRRVERRIRPAGHCRARGSPRARGGPRQTPGEAAPPTTPTNARWRSNFDSETRRASWRESPD